MDLNAKDLGADRRDVELYNVVLSQTEFGISLTVISSNFSVAHLPLGLYLSEPLKHCSQ